MASVIRSSGGRSLSKTKTSPANTKSTVKAPSFDLALPDKPSEPQYELEKITMLLHGEEKIGKTTFTSKFPDALLLMFEPGAKYLTVQRIPEQGQFSSWLQFTRVVDKIIKSDRFQTIVIDTADLAYELAIRHICEEAGEDNINDGSLSYGKGTDRVDNIFKEQILRITGTGRGVIFISHTKSQEYEKSTGVKYQKIVPTMKDRARRFLKGFVDITAYYGFFGEDRYIVVEGNEALDAGNRIDGRFITTKGETVFAIPVGDTPQEGYENFVSAFENKQTETHQQSRKVALSEVKAKMVTTKRK